MNSHLPVPTRTILATLFMAAELGYLQTMANRTAPLASIFRAALDRVGRAGSSQPVALIVACGCDESPDVAPVSGFS